MPDRAIMTPRDVERLSGVHPHLTAVLLAVFTRVYSVTGKYLFVVEGVRTQVQQAKLYAQGRSLPGRIVTYKDGVRFRSNHQPQPDGFGHAVDCAWVPTADLKDPFDLDFPWEMYGEQLELRGVGWGGRWKMSDLPHAELKYPYVEAVNA